MIPETAKKDVEVRLSRDQIRALLNASEKAYDAGETGWHFTEARETLRKALDR